MTRRNVTWRGGFGSCPSLDCHRRIADFCRPCARILDPRLTLSFSLRQVFDGALAQDCTLCGVRTRLLLCAACDADLPRMPDVACPQCGEWSPEGDRCGQCISAPPHFDATVAALRYEFPVDKLMQAFKFRAQLSLAEFFAKALARRMAATAAEFDEVVPMPMASARLAQRGYDQTTLIAEALVRELPTLVLLRRLTKLRDTPPQSGLDREARLKNVRGAFECTRNLTGRHVAILDDVMTTGATLSEAARALKKAGAARVTALAVARADHRNLTATAIAY